MDDTLSYSAARSMICVDITLAETTRHRSRHSHRDNGSTASSQESRAEDGEHRLEEGGLSPSPSRAMLNEEGVNEIIRHVGMEEQQSEEDILHPITEEPMDQLLVDRIRRYRRQRRRSLHLLNGEDDDVDDDGTLVFEGEHVCTSLVMPLIIGSLLLIIMAIEVAKLGKVGWDLVYESIVPAVIANPLYFGNTFEKV